MTVFGDQLYHLGGVPVGTQYPISQGKAIHLMPSSGTSGGSGKLNDPVSTYTRALALASADKNDIIIAYAEDNSASGTTVYLSSALDLNKDGIHIIGANSGGVVGQRSRIAQLSTATGVSPLVTWSGNNGSMSGIHIFHGVDDATSKICMAVTGDRNRFTRCHFAGIGHATMDVATACSLNIQGDENLFEDCTIGLDTIARGTAATYEVLFSGGATRNIFRRCRFISYAEDAGFASIARSTSGTDRWNLFEDCVFINMPTGDAGGTTMTEAFDVTAGGSPDGIFILTNCSIFGITDWENPVTGKVMIFSGTSTAATAGLGVDVAAS
jgi:hypothetical protein